MRCRHVRGVGGEAPAAAAAHVAGHALPVVEDLDEARREDDLNLFAGQLVGHRVAVALELDVVIDVHAGAPSRVAAVGLGGQRQEGRRVELEEDAPSAAVELLEGTLVEQAQLLRQRRVQLRQREEDAVAQRHEQGSV